MALKIDIAQNKNNLMRSHQIVKCYAYPNRHMQVHVYQSNERTKHMIVYDVYHMDYTFTCMATRDRYPKGKREQWERMAEDRDGQRRIVERAEYIK